jgi:hypothetical protein
VSPSEGRSEAEDRSSQQPSEDRSEAEDGPGEVTDGYTIAEAMQRLESDGYSGQFAARPGAMVRCFTCQRESQAGAVQLHRLVRTEGASDAADETVIAALTCPRCGARGTTVLNYGPEAPPDDAEVLRLLEDTRF